MKTAANKMKYVAYAIGEYFYAALLDKPDLLEQIEYLCDKDHEKQGLELWSKKVLSPKELSALSSDYDEILVFSKDLFNEIFDELVNEVGLNKEHVRLYEIDEQRVSAREKIGKNYLNNQYAKYESKWVELNEETLRDAHVLPNRAATLKYMPQNTVCCEIGVAYGDFSTVILSECNPAKFYAIDYFSQDRPYSLGDAENNPYLRENLSHQAWYEKRFQKEIDEGLLETRKGLSWEVLSQFPNDFFSYAYLDANHSYSCVAKDIEVLQYKIKSGGYIQFDDYCPYIVNPMNMRFIGVSPAVNQWINKTASSITTKVEYLTLSPYNAMNIVVQVLKK